jgi:hypothetical protein
MWGQKLSLFFLIWCLAAGLIPEAAAWAGDARQGGPNCQVLISRAMEQSPIRLTSLSKANLEGLSPIERYPEALVWTVPGPISAPELSVKLNVLLDHIINLSFAGSGMEMLFKQHPEYQEYLRPLRENIDRLLQAWTNPETGLIELHDPSLLLRPEAIEAQKQIREAVSLYNNVVKVSGERTLRAAVAIPNLWISGVKGKWMVRLFAEDGGSGVRVMVQNSYNESGPSSYPKALPGQSSLEAYGRLSRLFGHRPVLVASYHQHLFIKKNFHSQVTVGEVADALTKVAGETEGHFNKTKFLSALITKSNYSMLMLHLVKAGIGKKLSATFGDEFKAMFPESKSEIVRNLDGSYDFTLHEKQFERMFAKMSADYYERSENPDHSFRVWGWYAMRKFSERYFSDFNEERWSKVTDEFVAYADYKRTTSDEEISPTFVSFKGGAEYDTSFYSQRLKLDTVGLLQELEFEHFEKGEDIRNMNVFEFSASFLPYEQALRSADLENAHVQVLVHRIRQLLRLNPSG